MHAASKPWLIALSAIVRFLLRDAGCSLVLTVRLVSRSEGDDNCTRGTVDASRPFALELPLPTASRIQVGRCRAGILRPAARAAASFAGFARAKHGGGGSGEGRDGL